MGTKETQCTYRVHREVCAFKKDFLTAQEQVTTMMVSLGDKTTIRLCDIPFIVPVDLHCKFYRADGPVMR